MINVGSADRAVRLVIGGVLLLLSIVSLVGGVLAAWGSWRIAIGIVGLVLVGTATLRVCPAYMVLGIGTGERGKT